MPSLKTSVRLTEETQEVIKNISPFGKPNWAMGVNQVTHRYAELVKYALPEMTEFEKKALCAAFNGHCFGDDVILEAKSILFTVAECVQYDGHFIEHLLGGDMSRIGEGMQVGTAFYEKVKSWSIPQLIAVIHMIQEFWNGSKAIPAEGFE